MYSPARREILHALIRMAPACALAPWDAYAEIYPDKPITWVVAFAPGGASDALARLVAQEAAKHLGQAVVIDNRAGGGGILAARSVARATANGYTLFLGSPGSMIINPLLQPGALSYSPEDFTPVAPLARIHYALMVREGLQARTVEELIQTSKASPDGLTVGSAGIGSNTHLVAMSFTSSTGAKLRHVPYKGTSPAMSDLMAGNIDVLFDSVPVVIPQVQNKRFRVLAVTGTHREPAMPGTPTIAEGGAHFSASNWFGVFAPVHTPESIVARLNDAFCAALRDKSLRARLEASGNQPTPGTPRELGQLVQTERQVYEGLIRASNIRLE